MFLSRVIPSVVGSFLLTQICISIETQNARFNNLDTLSRQGLQFSMSTFFQMRFTKPSKTRWRGLERFAREGGKTYKSFQNEVTWQWKFRTWGWKDLQILPKRGDVALNVSHVRVEKLTNPSKTRWRGNESFAREGGKTYKSFQNEVTWHWTFRTWGWKSLQILPKRGDVALNVLHVRVDRLTKRSKTKWHGIKCFACEVEKTYKLFQNEVTWHWTFCTWGWKELQILPKRGDVTLNVLHVRVERLTNPFKTRWRGFERFAREGG